MPLVFHQHTFLLAVVVVAAVGLLFFATLAKLKSSRRVINNKTTKEQSCPQRRKSTTSRVILIIMLMSLLLLRNLYRTGNVITHVGGTRGGNDMYERHFILPQVQDQAAAAAAAAQETPSFDRLPSQTGIAQPHIGYKKVYAESHAIFLISFGQEESTLAERCILSLRRRGQWKGYIVLLTDASSSRYENVWSEKENVIVMHPKEEHFNGADGKPLAYNKETMSLKVKRFKTYVLDYVDMDQRLNDIETIYYLDIDILAGGTINHLFSGIEMKQMIDYQHQVRGAAAAGLSTLHFFTPITKEYPFQSGTFVVNRSSSRHCLELWRKEIDKIVGGNLGMDQAALRTVHQHIESGEETTCRLIRMDNEDYISFPMPRNFDEIAQSSSYTTLIHLSNSKFAKWIDEEKQNEFLYKVLQLSEEEIQSGKYGKSIIKLK